MTTIITPQSTNEDGSSLGLIVGILLGIVLVGAFFFMYALPRLTVGDTQKAATDINVSLPTGSLGGADSSNN